MFNNAISLDPVSKKKLLPLNGKIIVVQCTAPSLTISITVNDQCILLSPMHPDKADSYISGSASALLQLLTAKDKSKSIRAYAIQLKGDTVTIQAFQNILFSLNIDWEYPLSKVIGDIPTQALNEGLTLLKNFVNRSSASLINDIDEYIHVEINLLPTTDELENFYQRIDTLRLRLDRNQTRVAKFASN